MIELLAAAFGLVIGSFLNVCISRLPDDYSVVHPSRSQCPICGRMIESYDNIPLFSFLLLRGRCRYCRAPISLRYPLVELATAALFFYVARQTGWNWATVKWCLFSALLVELTVSDLETRILPDEFTKSGILLGLFLSPVVHLPEGIVSLLLGPLPRALGSFIDSCAGALLLAAGLWVIGELYFRLRGREGLGFGDVKFVALLGAFLGLESAILALVASSLLGLVLGLAWIKMRKLDPATYELPFGSFIGICGLGLMFTQFSLPL